MLTRFIISILALIALIFLLTPLVILIGASLTSSEYLSFPPNGLTLRWYNVILTDPSYVQSFIMSTILACCATIVSVLIAIPSSLALTRYDFPGRQLLVAMFSAPLVLPYLVLGSALFQFAGYFGFSQTFMSLLVGHVVIVTPFVMRSILVLITPGMMDLERAAADLGATQMQTLKTITLPLLRPGLITGSIFGFITSWINVELSMFNTTGALNTIPVQLFNYVQYSVDPAIAAVSAITILVAAIILALLDIFIGLDMMSDGKSGKN